jgi:hypothetical protein
MSRGSYIQSSSRYHHPNHGTGFDFLNGDDGGGDDVRDDFPSRFRRRQGTNQAAAHIFSLPCAACAYVPERWLPRESQ